MREILDSLSNAWLIIFCRRRMSGHIMLRFLILFSTSVMKSCHAGAAADTLLPTQSIRDGQTLVSAKKTFEFGFFSPGNSSNRYVGIWYHNISVITAVWVANRDGPIADTSGELTFTSDGNLMILDSRGRSSVFTYGSGTDNTAATILDSGNLVLRDLNDSARVLWQSFDNPTDHLLPGMFLGRRGNRNLLLTSWRSPVDPALGEFSFGADPNGTEQLVIWQQDNVYWVSGVWNGQYFSLFPELLSVPSKFTYVISDVEQGIFYSTDNPTRFKMDFTGRVELLIWLDSARDWLLFLVEPRPPCDVHNLCGAFGVCYENRTPYCECLEGFQPGSLTDWNQGVTGGGCLRLTNLRSCGSAGGKPDTFLPISHIKFPNEEATQLDAVMRGVQECESACLNNCTCTAYAFTGSCRLWHGDLLNSQHLDDNSGGTTLYLRLAASESESGGNNSPEIKAHRANKRKLWLTVSLIAIFVQLSFISIGCLLWWRRRKGIQKLNQEQTLILGTDIVSKLGDNDKRGVEFTLFSFSRIEDATCNFSNANKLGEGGFGPVYKGMLLEGQEIAVKRLSAHSGQGLEEFKNEILLIAKLQHRNLVRLLGCCIQREEKILVYEYMINKSLDFFLFDSARGQLLDWSRRFHIIDGIAQGLLYLHKYSRLRIIHRDLKASNILLDAEMNPKISDFGLARIFSPNEMEINTNRVVGTYGYMSPEYAAEGLFSTKSDVFSFGVLLLEIVSGKRNTSFHQDNNYLNLLGYAWELWKEGKSLELKDPTLEDTGLTCDIPRCVHIGLLCVQENAADRPTMSNVITMLSSNSTTLPNPKQPAFFTMRYARVADLPSNMHETNSLNSVTVTSIDGR